MKPELSIIIPCYNSEKTLEETLFSIINQKFQNWEAIIINDGSVDNSEKIALKFVRKDSRFKYFKTENTGLGAARNLGLSKADGNFILPLDSDNKIGKYFAYKAINILNMNSEFGIVYGDAEYFDERKGLWKVGDFDKYRILQHNYIDACAVIRKSLFDELGGYDENLPHQGHEDWEFWLRVIGSTKKFYYLPEITFSYRVTSNSMINSFSNLMINENVNYIKDKHAPLYIKSFSDLYFDYRHLQKNINSNKTVKFQKKLEQKIQSFKNYLPFKIN